MSRRAAGVPKYGLHKPTGQARVVLDHRDYYLGKYGTVESQQKYEQLVASWVASRRTILPGARGRIDLTVNELLLAYLKHAEQYYRADGLRTSEYDNIADAVRLLQERHGLTPVRDFGPLALRAVRDAMIAAGWTRKSINKHVHRIRRVFRWGVAQELVEANVLHALLAVESLSAQGWTG